MEEIRAPSVSLENPFYDTTLPTYMSEVELSLEIVRFLCVFKKIQY